MIVRNRVLLLGAAILAMVVAPSTASAASAPVNTAAPSITGSADVGRTLTATPGTWTGDPTPTYAYQWQRCTVGSSYDSNVLGSVGNDPWGIALDSAGNVYTANYSGGSGSTVSKLLPNGTPAGGNWPVSIPSAIDIFIDSSDNIFVAGGPWFSKLSTSGAVAFTNLTGQSGARGIVTDSSGNIYVANSGTDTVSKFDSSGTAAGGVWPVTVGDGPTDLVIDSSGNLFTSNETSENVSKVTPGGTVTTFGSTGLAPQTLALDSSGNILVPNFSSKLRKITPDGSSSTNLGDTGGLPRGIVLDPSDNAFTANASGSSRNVTQITPTGTSTVIADVGSQPHGITRDAAGNLYVSNLGDDNVSKLSPSLSCTDISGADDPTYTLTATDEGKKIRVKVTATNSAGTANTTSAATAPVGPEPSPSIPVNNTAPSISGDAEVGSTLTADKGTWSGYPEPTFAYQWQRCEEGAPSSSILGTTGTNPYGITIDPSGNVYTANDGSNNVTKITPGGVSTTLGTTGANPIAITIDSSGNVYTANYGSNNVTKITPGGVSTTLGTTGNAPRAITTDSSGNVYTANYASNNVTKITPGGVSSTLGTTGTFPIGITIDSSGNVYAANYFSSNVTKITPGGVSTTLGTTGTNPAGITIDSSGNVYTPNFSSNDVTKITPGGVSTTLGITGANPIAITIDSSGNVYTANYSSNDVTKITPGGVSVTLGTTGTNPFSITIDSSGNPYTANLGSNNVTKISSGLTCTDISGADDPTYTLTGDDEGKKIRVTVTGTNTAGSASANSAPTATVDPLPVPANTDPPTISGTPEVGQELTADPGTWTGDPTFAYQWQRCDADGNNCTDISGADDSTYTLNGDDEGKKIRVKVTATNGAGSTDANSAPTATVEPEPVSPPENTSPPTVSGTAQQGQTLITESEGTWTGDPIPTFTYQWQRCDQAPPTPSVLGTTGSLPNGIVLDDSGNVYTANLSSNNVTKITPDGTSSTYGTTGSQPNDLVFDSAGNLFSSNQGSNNVTKITPGGSSSIFSPTGFLARAIAIDSSDNLYVPNLNGGNVTKITPAGTPSGTAPFYTWAETGPGSSPIAAVVDRDGNVYVANSGSNSVTKITPAGTASQFATTGGFPYDIAIDGEGNIYTTNIDSQNVTKITPAGEASILGSTGRSPASIAVDGAGNVYTANQNENTVTQITPFGVSSVYSTTGDGPRALTVDQDGNVYTANFASNNVTKIVPGELNCTDIDGATEVEYTAAAADVGKKLRIKITATNSEGSETAESQPTATVVPDEVSVTIEKSGGTVTSDPAGINCGATCTANFPFNQQITLSATPESGKSFDEANSDCPGQGWTLEEGAYRCVITSDEAVDVSISFRSPTTIWVGTGSTGGGSCESPDYNTVGLAAANAIAGDTIRICEGEFTGAESGKPLTFEGEGAGKTIIGPGGTEGPAGFSLFGDGASSTFKNLTIRGAAPAIGAFSQGGDPLTIENVAFEDNGASQPGGAIFSNNPVNISGSTFVGNASSIGSAVIAYGPVTVVNSTLTNNEYVEPPQNFRTTEDRSVLGGVASPDYFQGGVIVTLSFAGSEDPSDISLTNVTLAGNDPGLSASLTTLCVGEGPCPPGPEFPSGDIEVDNSIIAEEGAGCGTPNSGLIFGGGNVVQNTTTGCDALVGGPPAPTTQVTASSIALQPLALNAPGDTETMALGSSSVARGAAVSAKCPETDQRGVARPSSSCDSGAYQASSAPSGKPKLKVTVKAPKKVKAGKKFTIRVKTTNKAKAPATRSTASSSPGTTAKKVKTCVKLPRGVFVVNARGGKVSGRSVCWTRSSLAAGRSANYSVVVRSSSSDSGNARITASVRGSNSSGAKARASAKAKIDVIDPKPQPKPKPPTG